MQGRTILILVVVLVALAAVATLFETNRRRATRASGKALFPRLKVEQVDGLRFRDSGKEVDLVKQNGEWLVRSEGNNRAEQKQVEEIVTKLPDFPSDEIVSNNPERHSLFKVDSTGIEVWVDQEGKEIAHFIVGKPGPDFLSTYVRKAGSDEVLLAPAYLPSLFQRGDTWREKTILQINQDDIRRFEYASPTRGNLALSMDEDGAWSMTEPESGTADGGRLTMPLRTISQLRAAGFADTMSAATTGLDADTSWIAVETADGARYTLEVGSPAPGLRAYVRKKGKEQIYTLPRGTLKTLFVNQTSLLGTPIPD